VFQEPLAVSEFDQTFAATFEAVSNGIDFFDRKLIVEFD
jgi:hypothetical protein